MFTKRRVFKWPNYNGCVIIVPWNESEENVASNIRLKRFKNQQFE